jgi:hypothetical protein
VQTLSESEIHETEKDHSNEKFLEQESSVIRSQNKEKTVLRCGSKNHQFKIVNV